ncbi:hypothetical protein ACFYXS_39035 [Streptomyces sp. NPDC002574]|uniref:hypothetical protein n=1 Tax=Streptomyces sp. NPDC002574 TaxID=3364652 RepID=UPI003694140F
MYTALLRRIARRCDIHDRSSPLRIRELEEALGMPLSPEPYGSLTIYLNRDPIGCGRHWCRTNTSNSFR